LMDASRMLICGEDLGMVPDSVPMVLDRLGLLSLEVQRWPKRLGQRLGDPAGYPYLSVCTTSTHDMSTVRGWWEEEPETRQFFWTEVMRRRGVAESVCSPEVCRFIVEQNLAAASMWCILPLQDWLGVEGRLRHAVVAEERINVPAIPRHYWRYRMHLSVEALLQEDGFTGTVRQLIAASGRHWAA
jgi:4-alpha-glucanotransferase